MSTTILGNSNPGNSTQSLRRYSHLGREWIGAVLATVWLAGSIIATEVAPSFRWARQAGAPDGYPDFGFALAVDAAGNCYQAGSISGNAQFGNTSLTKPGLFVAKYDRTGELVWVTQDGETQYFYGISPMGLGLDAANNVYVLCNFDAPTAVFGGLTLTNPGATSVVLAKYDSSGAPLWANLIFWSDWIYSSGLAVDDAGNCYWTGVFQTTANSAETNVTGSSIVAKYDDQGRPVWINTIDAGNAHGGADIAIDPAGNVYVAGTVRTGLDTE